MHVFRLTWGTTKLESQFRLRGSHPLWHGFPSASPIAPQCYVVAPLPQHSSLWWFGLLRFRSPLLAESSFLSFPPGTEMFHFPGFARTLLSFQSAVTQHYLRWVSPFGCLRIIAWLAAPRSFSQLPASFFASYRLGIHRVPLVAWSLRSSQLLIRKDQGPARLLYNLPGCYGV